MSRSKTLPAKVATADASTREAVMRGTPDGQLGPCMQALNERQRLFVIYLLETGSTNHTRAAAFAGYSADSPNSLRVTAHHVAHNAKVLAAMHEEAQRRMRSSAIMATTRLVEIANDKGHKDQLKAIGMVLDRSGLHATSEHKVTVENVTDDQAMVDRVVALCKGLNVDPRTMLGQVKGLTIDAEFLVINGPENQLVPLEHQDPKRPE